MSTEKENERHETENQSKHAWSERHETGEEAKNVGNEIPEEKENRQRN